MKAVTLITNNSLERIEFRTVTGEFGFDLFRKKDGILGIDTDDEHYEIAGLSYNNVEKSGEDGDEVYYELVD